MQTHVRDLGALPALLCLAAASNILLGLAAASVAAASLAAASVAVQYNVVVLVLHAQYNY